MTRTSSREKALATPVLPVAVILLRLAVLVLVVISMVEVLGAISAVVYDIMHKHEITLLAALIVLLVPASGALVWGCKAVFMTFGKSIRIGFQYFRDYRDKARPSRWFERGWRATRQSGAGVWMGAAFCVALALAVIALALFGTGPSGVHQALRITGRWSLLLFWPAYAGGAAATLFGPRFSILARRGREFGLAYAAAQLVHLSLVARLVANSDGPFLQSIMPFFAVGVVWTYLLALSSLKRFSGVFASKDWRILRAIGLEYLALVFLADFVLAPITTHSELSLEYLPFSILIIIGPLLRLAAAARGLACHPRPTHQTHSWARHQPGARSPQRSSGRSSRR
jgi:hypothetical protein